jgi:hypothetical protein
MEKYRPMLLKDFFSRFPDEDSCVVDLQRQQEGEIRFV